MKGCESISNEPEPLPAWHCHVTPHMRPPRPNYCNTSSVSPVMAWPLVGRAGWRGPDPSRCDFLHMIVSQESLHFIFLQIYECFFFFSPPVCLQNVLGGRAERVNNVDWDECTVFYNKQVYEQQARVVSKKEAWFIEQTLRLGCYTTRGRISADVTEE